MHKTAWACVLAAIFAACSTITSKEDHNANSPSIYEVARYLERTPLYISTADLDTGTFSPSYIYRVNHGTTGCSKGNSQLMLLEGALAEHHVVDFTAPPHVSQLSVMRNPNFCSSNSHFQLPLPTCVEDTESVTVPENFALNDLDFVVVNRAPRCSDNIGTIANIKDVDLMQSQLEQAIEKFEFAGSRYSDNEIIHLLFLLPFQYRGQPDSRAGLPENLLKFVRIAFADIATGISMRFKSKPYTSLNLTFDIKSFDPQSSVNYGGWYEARSDENDSLVYVSPVLARAPFFLCYNKGVSAIADFHSKHKSDSITQHYDKTIDDDASAVEHANDQLFGDCLKTQSAFIFGHEIGHKLVNKSDFEAVEANEVERRADCFGYINSKLEGAFDPTIFSQLLKNPAATDAEKRLLGARYSAMIELDRRLGKSKLPQSGEEIVQTCKTIARSQEGDK